jgi:hypothetical protein
MVEVLTEFMVDHMEKQLGDEITARLAFDVWELFPNRMIGKG